MIESALQAIPSDDRQTWLRIGGALKTEFGDAGFDLWNEWSRDSDAYDARSMPAQWRSLRAGAISIGTLWYIAKQYGWTPDGPLPARKVRRKPDQDAKHQRQIESEARKAAEVAQDLISKAHWTEHAYLEGKGFTGERGLVLDKDTMGAVFKKHGFRVEFEDSDDELLIPVRDAEGKLLSVQRIAPDGGKLFLPKSQVRGGRFQLGRGREVYVVEGYATALSVMEALKVLYRKAQVVIAFSAANVAQVAKPGHRIIADRDLNRCANKLCRYTWDDPMAKDSEVCPACLDGRVLVGAGQKYARQTGCVWTLPPIPGDMNDVHVHEGLEEVVRMMRALINGGNQK